MGETGHLVSHPVADLRVGKMGSSPPPKRNIGRQTYLFAPPKNMAALSIIWVEDNISDSCVGCLLSGHCFTDLMLGLLLVTVGQCVPTYVESGSDFVRKCG